MCEYQFTKTALQAIEHVLYSNIDISDSDRLNIIKQIIENYNNSLRRVKYVGG